MRRNSLLTVLAVLATLPLGAAVFTYTEATSTTTEWAAGTSWDAVPVSAANTTLTFTNSLALPAGTIIVSDNDIAGNFLLNRLNFLYPGPASGTAPMLYITGNPLEFAGANAQLLFSPIGATVASRPSLTISNQIVLSSNLAVYATSDQTTALVTLNGRITGANSLTFDGANGVLATLVLSSPLNDHAGNTAVVGGGSSADTRTIRLGAAGVIPNGAGKGNLALSSGGDGAVTARVQLNGYDETINGLVAGVPSGPDSRQTVQNGAATAATLTIGDNDTSASFIGQLANGSSGALNVTKIGAGTQILAGSSTHTGATTVVEGTLQIDYALWSASATDTPANYFSTVSGLTLGSNAALAIKGRRDGAAIAHANVVLGQYDRTIPLPNAIASQLSVGQVLTLVKTGGGGTPATGVYISSIGAPGASTTVIYSTARLGGTGGSTVTVTTSNTVGTTRQTVKSLTLGGTAGSNATIDFGTSDTVVLTFSAAPIQINDGSTLTIANWNGTVGTGGGAERLVFVGDPTDFSSVLSQSEVIFDGFGPGYQLVSGAGSYEVVAKQSSTGTVVAIR